MDSQPLALSAFTSPSDIQSRYPSPPADSDLDCTTSYICPQHVTKSAEPTVSLDATVSRADSPSDHTSAGPSKKKRKSWGQVLPEPTTNLPPRKRAKTDAEKEQRKYERVQRNRQAAHNSRMRKQEEMDNLSRKNDELESKCRRQMNMIMRLQNELARLGKLDLPVSDMLPPSPTYSYEAPPSLDPASPTDSSSTDYDHAPTPVEFKMEQDSVLDTKFDVKQFNDSHSAVAVELADHLVAQWTSPSSHGMTSDNVQDVPIPFEELLNLDGLTNSAFSDSEGMFNFPTDFDTDLLATSGMDTMGFDPKSLDLPPFEPFTFNTNDSGPFNSFADPPMFTLHSC